MSKKTIAQLFSEKRTGIEAVLGSAKGEVNIDNRKDRFYQEFEKGVILSKGRNIDKVSDLICIYGKLFLAWWEKPDAAWIGEPLEDLFKTKNREGHEIMVQRFENGVINCRADGKNDVQWLSWHDWWAISKPGCHKDTAP